MTIRIIGKVPTNYGAHCIKCGTRFLYELDDVRANYRIGGEGVWCPTCGEWHPHRGPSAWNLNRV